jgi:hypothetical protein
MVTEAIPKDAERDAPTRWQDHVRSDCDGARDARGHAGVARSTLRQEKIGERKSREGESYV